MKYIDSVYPNLRFKKKLIDQPSYEKLGLNTLNSKNGDATIESVVNYYEAKYGEITLNKCDFQTPVFEKYKKCKESNKIPATNSDEAILSLRNTTLFENVKKSSHQKIAVIFGSEHLSGYIKLVNNDQK